MTENTAFIWDLDGTLLDSYDVIVSSLHAACLEHRFLLDKESIRREVITSSVSSFLERTARETGLSFSDLRASYSAYADREMLSSGPMKNAAETLRILKERGAAHFVFTHRGASSEIILKHIGLYGYFREIVTGSVGFARKPDPSAINYLVEKYALA